MLLFNVTFSVSKAIDIKWEEWAKSFLVEYAKKEYEIEEAILLRLITNHSPDQSTYTLQLRSKKTPTYASDFQRFQNDMTILMIEKYPKQVHCFFTVLEPLASV